MRLLIDIIEPQPAYKLPPVPKRILESDPPIFYYVCRMDTPNYASSISYHGTDRDGANREAKRLNEIQRGIGWVSNKNHEVRSSEVDYLQSSWDEVGKSLGLQSP